jgi:hypothetical protein
MRKRVIAFNAILLSAAAFSAASAVPTITIDWDPRLPGHVENPGGLFSGDCWVDPGGSTPGDLIVTIFDPSDVAILQVVLPEYLEYHVDWNVPEGAPDGIYHYQVDFTTQEGDYASVRAGFLVAGSLTGLCGLKFIDENGNGVFDDTEVFAEGWEICATGASDLGCLITNEDGLVCWFGIPAGDYEVCETLQAGYENTTGGVCQLATVLDGEIHKVIFGNRLAPTPTIQGSWGSVKAVYR